MAGTAPAGKEKNMEKIKLCSGKELNLIVCGIIADQQTVTIKFLPGGDSLDTLNTILMDTDETEKMILLSESGEQLAIYNGYTQLQSIGQELVIGYEQNESQSAITGKIVTAVLRKRNTTEKRLTSLEETIDILAMEILGM